MFKAGRRAAGRTAPSSRDRRKLQADARKIRPGRVIDRFLNDDLVFRPGFGCRIGHEYNAVPVDSCFRAALGAGGQSRSSQNSRKSHADRWRSRNLAGSRSAAGGRATGFVAVHLGSGFGTGNDPLAGVHRNSPFRLVATIKETLATARTGNGACVARTLGRSTRFELESTVRRAISRRHDRRRPRLAGEFVCRSSLADLLAERFLGGRAD